MRLSTTDKERIVELRKEGYGYGFIGKEINFPSEQIKDYCQRNGLGGVKANIEPAMPKTCKWCGKEFYRTEAWASVTYCSSECKDNYWANKRAIAKENKKPIIKKCVTCGKEFAIKNAAEKYCCDECKYETNICERCGKEFKSRISKGKRTYCSSQCGAKAVKEEKQKSHEDYCEEFTKIHKWKIVPVTQYQGADKEITVKCFECGKETTRKASAFIGQGKRRGCQYCCKQLSTTENVIEDWLIENNIKYVRQYKDGELTDKGILRFDFAVLDNEGNVKLLIEYNGEQHYRAVDYFGGEDTFKSQQVRDEIKREYAKKIGVPLIEISYKEKNGLQETLNATLN